jgi:hypothetical protein
MLLATTQRRGDSLPAIQLMAGVLAACVVGAACSAEPSVERRNWFDTPFGSAVMGLAACPQPEGPLITEAEMRQQAHGRIERGTSCWLAKKCEDSNVYRRDPEIQQRVVDAIRHDRTLTYSSIWVTTERRWITLQGCLQAQALRAGLIDKVRRIDGVEAVSDQLMIGTRDRPRWKVDPAWRPDEHTKKGRRGEPRRPGGARAKETEG